MYKLSIKIICCLLFLFTHIHSLPLNIDLLIESAKSDYLAGKSKNYSEDLNQILSESPENPTANILKGLVLLESENISQRQEAKKIIEKYYRKLENDAFSNYAMGMLYKKRDVLPASRKYFEKSLEWDDCMVPAMIELGNYYYQQMLRYYHRYTYTEFALSYRKYALEDYDYAVSYLRKALKCDPSNLEAAYLLGSLYYETGDYTLMKNLFQEFLEIYPQDNQLNQFLGLAYLSQNEYREAVECFETALQQLSDEDKQDLYSPEYLAKANGKSLAEEEINSFWLKRDPMFITEENERLLEHFGRFAYANLRFGVPKLNEEGWRTDRGKTYIRYGKPMQIIEYGKSHEFNAIYPPMQIWMYSQFQLAFSDEFWNGLYQFTEPFNSSLSIFKERTNINYSLVAENVQAVIPERFDFHLPGGEFTSPYLIKFFKENDQTKGDILFGIPMEETLYYPIQKFETALFALNDNQIPEDNFRDSIEIDFESDSANILEDYSIQVLSFYQTAGKLPYSFEVLNTTLQKGFVSRNEIRVPNLSSDSLLISDILLADRISPASGDDNFVKNNFNIVPNLLQLFFSKDTIRTYFEVYNLVPDQLGNVHFRIESTIKKDQKRGIFNRFFKPDQKAISVVNEYSGRRTDEFIIQAIDLNNIEQGEYSFEITVHDDVGKSMSRRKTKLIVLENLNN